MTTKLLTFTDFSKFYFTANDITQIKTNAEKTHTDFPALLLYLSDKSELDTDRHHHIIFTGIQFELIVLIPVIIGKCAVF